MRAVDWSVVVDRRAASVWAAAVLVYVSAIFGRTSFGVAGVQAMDHFAVDASRIAVFASVQVGVYALAQIPTGILIDRHGPRFMLVAGALVMATGQVLLGLISNYSTAIAARVLVGAGDATAFLSVLRLIPFWFPPRRAPIIMQLTSSIGSLGQFLSAVPFQAVLNRYGWCPAFVSVGAVGFLVALAAAVAVVDTPEHRRGVRRRGVHRRGVRRPGVRAASRRERAEARARKDSQRIPVSRLISTAVRSPVCWQAFFLHGLGMLFSAVFTLAWGVPTMTLGLGLSPARAGAVLTLMTVAGIVVSPFAGVLSARAGSRRAVVGAVNIAAWALFLASPSPRGALAATLVAVTTALTTPLSNFGFDTVRETLPNTMVATGTGLSNMGGFVATMVASQAFGAILEAHSRGGAYSWADFRVAWAAVVVVWFVWLVCFAVARRRVTAGAAPGGR